MWDLDLDTDFENMFIEEDFPPPFLTYRQRTCFHDWKAILLLTSTVYDCSKCGAKKEDIDRK